MINIVTYNVLSPELSEPATFPENTNDECDGAQRLPRILAKIQIQIQNNAIISLQEVSITWLGALHELFDRHNYHYTHTLYGGWYSGYMGVGLAFPRALYSLSTFEISRIADTKEWPRLTTHTQKQETKTSASESTLTRTWNYSAVYLRNVFDPLFVLSSYAFGSSTESNDDKKTSATNSNKRKKQQEDPPDVATFYRAKKRWNQAILVRLQRKSDGRIFCVTNYHNPCAIDLRPIITFHAAMYLMKAQKFAKNDPLIVCGDFNMTPDSGGYQLTTTGQLELSHSEYPTLPAGDSWKPTVVPMISALASVLGEEPELTNKAVRLIGKWGAEPSAFSGTLDYIFISKGLRAVATLPLPSSNDLAAKSFPTNNIPSDHLLIGASVELTTGINTEESKM